MSTWKKVAIGAIVVVLLASMIGFTVYRSHKNVVVVQTAKAKTMDLASVVSASGEVKPKTYVNIGANAFGKITQAVCQRRRAGQEGADAGAAGKCAVFSGRECRPELRSGRRGLTQLPPMRHREPPRRIWIAPSRTLSAPNSIGLAPRDYTKAR